MLTKHSVALWFLAATVFAIPWQETVFIVGIGSIARLIGIAAIGLTVVAVSEPGRIRLRPPTLFLTAAALYIGWIAVSFVWTIDPLASRESIVTHVQLLIFAWAIWQLGVDERDRLMLAQAFVLGSFVAAVNVIFVFLFRTESINIDGRVTALGANENDVATVMAIALTLAWLLANKSLRATSRLVNYLYLPIGLAAVLLTGSRGGSLVALVALTAIPLTLSRLGARNRVAVVAVLTITLSGLALVPNAILERATPALERLSDTPQLIQESNFTGRTVIWRGGADALLERPLVGHGAHSFPAATRQRLGFSQSAHNAFLSVSVGTGLVGLTLFCLMLLAALVAVLLQTPSETRTAHLILFAALIVAFTPLGWEYEKTAWFVLALISSERGLLMGIGISRSPGPPLGSGIQT